MTTWSEVLTWDPEPLADASDGLRRLHTSMAEMGDDAQAASSRVISRAPSVEAALGALHRCTAAHSEMTERIGVLTRATADACEGVTQVRRRVLACQDFAAEHPYLTLGADGSVSVSLAEAAGSGADKATGSAVAAAVGPVRMVAVGLGGAMVEAVRAQAHAAELEEMVSSTLTLATQVDEDYATVLAGSSYDSPDQARSGRQGTDPRDIEDSRRKTDDSDRKTESNRRSGNDDPEAQGKTELGDPVPGEHAEMPGVTPWVYPGDTAKEGSGQYGARPADPFDHLVHDAAMIAAAAKASDWPDASKNLLHYLGNSGEPQELDADRMLEDVDELSAETHERVEEMTKEALKDAQASGVTGPVTYPFTTEWRGYYIDAEEDQNWFYATGGCNYATEGTVTVYPPTADNPEWTYSYDYRVHVADRYNWDGDKSTQIGPFNVKDSQLQELHRAGLAQEYDMSGESSVMHGSGS
ncbi:hypothetical protein SAMN05216355_11818 [Actinomyces ruminicola]|uniref:Uncharacterized protein n=1 Tax=Actinomyces ruminicola TaxID=332524 RepID=A0A1H0EQZ3_9ACTO|nr:hypothetical protein [Actinomyces ruminicola]SDN84788.1 hypothetical protein SAMN05216355_11818 [Actinomyces ruminicola]